MLNNHSTHNMRGYRAATIVAFLLLLGIVPGLIGTAHAQTRRVYLEEFNSSWCGYCVLGNYVIEQLEKRFPGQVAIVCYHVADAMSSAQGDSISGGKAFPQATYGVPKGWSARTRIDSSWSVDPVQWTPVANLGSPPVAKGIVDTMIEQTAQATVSLSNVTFDPATLLVSATVSTTFLRAMTGDFRLNLMVTEDSVSEAAYSKYNQTNYYSKSDKSYGDTLPLNPFYNSPYTIQGWQHRYVFLEAVAGVRGAAGIIPASVTAGAKYSQTFSFKLSDATIDPNNIRLVGIVHEFSATDTAKNEVFDAEVAHLTTVKIPFITADVSAFAIDGTNITVKSNQQTTASMTYHNNGSSAVTLGLSVDPAYPLPTGWTASIAPATLLVNPSTSRDATITIVAPDQSGCANLNIIATPEKDGAYSHSFRTPLRALSDNTRYGVYYTPGFSLSTSILKAIPNNLVSRTALIPLYGDAITAWPIEKMDLAIFDNDPVLGGVLQTPTNTVSAIQNLLDNGKPVFFSSDNAMSAQYYTPNPDYFYGSTDDARSFFEDTLGIKYRTTDLRYDSTTGTYYPFSVKGTSDPIGIGDNATILKSKYSAPFDISPGSNSSPIFYFDNTPAKNAGIRYTNPQTGGRMVYLDFNLNAIEDQSIADRIASRSIEWLLGLPLGVTAAAQAPSRGLTATPNPFHGATQISYSSASGERDVTFTVFDILGREVASPATHEERNGADQSCVRSYSASFDASALADGTYTIVVHSSLGTHEIRAVNSGKR